MLKHLIIIALLAINCKPPTQPLPLPDKFPDNCFTLPQYKDEAWETWTDKSLSQYFLLMRNSDLKCYSKFNSDMHIAMRVWRDRLGEGTKEAQLESLLGKPNIIINAGNIEKYIPARDEVLQIAVKEIPENPGIKYHIFFWRNWHDYLWFKTDGKKVIKADMYYAYE